MIKVSKICRLLGVCIASLQLTNVYAREWSLEADVVSRVEYNDNIFLVNDDHDGVSSIVISPSIKAIVKEKNWQTELIANLRSNRYSDQNLDSNDQYFDLTGSYNAQRNIFSLNASHDFDSNLTTTSSDFGVAAQRVNRKLQKFTPQYTRLLSERAALSLSYVYTDVDYIDAENTGFVPYITETGVVFLQYNLTEKDKININFTGVDYTSKNDLLTYQTFTSRFGIDHKFSKTLSTNLAVGVSRQSSTNLSTQTSDFFGNIIVRTQVVDAENRSFVLDASIIQSLENGSVTGKVSRSNSTNSFGGLNEVDSFNITYNDKISPLWRYLINIRYDDITAISSGTQDTDRELFFFGATAYYSISRNWKANASYQYVMKRTKNDAIDSTAPHSNKLTVGLTYNFPSLSTF